MGSLPPIMMANLGMADTLILMVLALVVFGPRRLPQIGRQIGKLMYEFRKASNDFKFQMEEELRNAEEADRRKRDEEERQRSLAAAPSPAQLESTAPQAPEAGAAALETGERAASATDGPYPDESTYPSAETPQAESAAPPAAEPAVPRAVPRIQPPSTGETVAAEHPGKAPESINSEAVTSGPEAERSEPAAHHG